MREPLRWFALAVLGVGAATACGGGKQYKLYPGPKLPDSATAEVRVDGGLLGLYAYPSPEDTVVLLSAERDDQSVLLEVLPGKYGVRIQCHTELTRSRTVTSRGVSWTEDEKTRPACTAAFEAKGGMKYRPETEIREASGGAVTFHVVVFRVGGPDVEDVQVSECMVW